MNTAAQPTYRFGAFELDVANRQLLLQGQPVALRARPFDLLAVLVENAGRLVTKDELLDRVWPRLVVEENNLQVHVAGLRKVLGHDAIATIPGRGYRFTRPIDAVPGTTLSMNVPSAIASDAAVGTMSETSPAIDAHPTDHTPGALPQTASLLIGRDDDVEVLAGWLRQHRLVTLAGSGGIGKTRLAQAVAWRMQAGGAAVAWIELAQLSDPALVASHVASALSIDLASGKPPLDALVDALRARTLLLTLDNAEHVLGAVAEITTALLVGTPNVRVLVTSLAPLRLSPEHVYRLTALSLPPAADRLAAADALRYGAVAFFVARARAAARAFELTDDNAPAVCEICRRLDGVPLELELAAARVPLLGIDALSTRLDERFRLLRRGGRDAPSRQQTLEAMFDWSHQLLSPGEQAVFRRLGALVGRFTLDEACVVARDAALDDWMVIDLLGMLVDRSLVAVEGDAPPHYRLLETARAYALDKLRGAGEYTALDTASRLHERAGDRDAEASASARAVEHFSAALEVASLLPESAGRDARELDICLKLGPAVQTMLGPAHPRCEEVYRRAVDLARGGAANERAFKALWGYWHFLCMAGRDREAAPYADEIVAMGRTLGDDGLELEACHAALTTQQLLGNAPAMVANAERAIALYDHQRHHRLTFAFGGHDPGICALGQGSVGLWLTGHPDKALQRAADALALGKSVEHAYSRAVAYYYTAMMYAAAGRLDDFRRSAGALVELADEHEMEMLGTEARFFVGYGRFENGDATAGIAEMRAALATIEAGGDLAFVLFYISLLAGALLATGDLADADALLERGFSHAAAGQGFFLPELYRLRGELRNARGDQTGAVREWRTARDLAERQGAVALAQRAERSERAAIRATASSAE